MGVDEIVVAEIVGRIQYSVRGGGGNMGRPEYRPTCTRRTGEKTWAGLV